MKKFRKTFGFLKSGKQTNKKDPEKEIAAIVSALSGVNFSFREGFSDRLMIKINLMVVKDPLEVYYNNLSRLFPKIIGFSFAAIVLMGLILLALHGSLSPDKFLGADRIDENNFITYLILQK
jgi:hypothetical protein